MIAALLCLALAGAARAEDGFDVKLYRWATGFDTLKNEYPREGRDTDYPSLYGTRVDRGCFDGAVGAERRNLQDRFDLALEEAVRGLQTCHARYPTLKYLSDALTVLRRSVVVCSDPEKDPTFQGPKAAGAYARRRGLKDHAHPRVREDADDHPAKYAHQWFIAVPKSLEHFMNGPRPGRARMLLHEALHYTGAGSRLDHNDIERVRQDPDAPCRPNYLDDRVVLLTTLCGFDESADPTVTSESELRYRIDSCGLRRACVEPLMHRDPGVWKFQDDEDGRDVRYEHGEGWGFEEAGLFCAKVNGVLRTPTAAMRREAPDAAGKQRLMNARRFFERKGGGLGKGIPAFYFAVLPKAQMIRLSQVPDLDKKVSSCGLFEKPLLIEQDKLSAYVRLDPKSVADAATLLPFDPAPAPASCPLATASPLFADAGILGEFHNREEALQKASLGAVEIAEMYLAGRLESLEGFDPLVRQLYAAACPKDPAAFRPGLCESGEKLLLDAAAEVRARTAGL